MFISFSWSMYWYCIHSWNNNKWLF